MSLPLIPISVLVQTKNEEVGIAACLEGLRDFDEVIVVDSNSTDRTAEIAEAHGVRVQNFTWDGKYPKKKQWQLDELATRHDWVLFIDADETPSEELIGSIRRAASDMGQGRFAAYNLRLHYVFSGRALNHGHRVVKRALVHRQFVEFPVIDDLDAPGMGELEGHYQPECTGSVGELRGRLRHDDKDPVRTWFDRHNRYSDWESYLRVNSSLKAAVASKRTAKGRIFDAIPFKPLVFFGYSYVLRLGFLDGRAGFDYAVALSTYYWQISLKTRELNRAL